MQAAPAGGPPSRCSLAGCPTMRQPAPAGRLLFLLLMLLIASSSACPSCCEYSLQLIVCMCSVRFCCSGRETAPPQLRKPVLQLGGIACLKLCCPMQPQLCYIYIYIYVYMYMCLNIHMCFPLRLGSPQLATLFATFEGGVR